MIRETFDIQEMWLDGRHCFFPVDCDPFCQTPEEVGQVLAVFALRHQHYGAAIVWDETGVSAIYGPGRGERLQVGIAQWIDDEEGEW